MFEAHQAAAWAHTANIMALIAEVNRDRNKRPMQFTAADFNPYAKRRTQEEAPKANISVLKALFVEKDKPFRLSEHLRRN